MLTMIAALLAAAPVVGDEPIAAAGKWQVDFGESACTASRTFSDAGRKVEILIERIPFESGTLMFVVGDAKLLPDRLRDQISLVAENGSSAVSDYAAINHVAGGRRVLKLYLASDYLKTLTKATSLKVMGAGLDVPPLRLDGMEALSSVLDGCERTFIKDLGIDLAGVADIAIPASAIKPTDVFDPADYPPEAIKRDLEGDTYILWQIDASGEPQECRILKSSGYDILDQRSCSVIMKRGRFVPARDSGGRSVDSYMSRRVRWRMVR